MRKRLIFGALVTSLSVLNITSYGITSYAADDDLYGATPNSTMYEIDNDNSTSDGSNGRSGFSTYETYSGSLRGDHRISKVGGEYYEWYPNAAIDGGNGDFYIHLNSSKFVNTSTRYEYGFYGGPYEVYYFDQNAAPGGYSYLGSVNKEIEGSTTNLYTSVSSKSGTTTGADASKVFITWWN